MARLAGRFPRFCLRKKIVGKIYLLPSLCRYTYPDYDNF